ncbi:DUF3157 family protein [Shewanella psychrotolerans]|uniref:DUF3157 family protein n=1 Tax=Shewanella psychrotolerans TaxID=2864206 RepID=UPI001C66153C|nr:DUF3157 family protein [Shewanella psychrotolerans]QYK01350.1 DUF3157 family protein [Shewanella psychrotolerans]
MYKTLQSCAIAALILFAVPSYAEESTPEQMTIVTLKNGATVKLNDDFTWEYVFLETTPTEAAAKTQSATPTTATTQSTTAIAEPVTVIATEAEVAGTLTNSAMAQSSLLKSTAKGGVKVSFINSQWDNDGRLGLNFELASSSSENYVEIELEIGFFADSGTLIKKETLNVWQAIFRMPETYLRRGQTRNSETFWIKGIDKTQWNKQLMTLKIIDMSSR